ncbi:zinc protease [Devosia sp. Leaf420]|uniref:M16 family metallopeptidase n=1 Tax=Devosia sp. Leaf420 TaxID=1736374 RepID=UPI0007128C5E|nr:pitrilysin family protein [Devosia sp. Leaf420]KQT44698.1 zinc protease [Devosia sp. Leaf420]
MHRPMIALVAALFTALPVAAEETPLPTVSHFMLENGLELVVIPDRRAPVVTHMVWYRTGAADDPAGQSGVAHFLEHLMFKGTAKYPAGTLESKVNELGGETNAFTNADVTVYFQTVPPDALAEMMDIEADRMRNLVLAPEVIDSERAVVLDERRQRVDSQPRTILSEAVNATLYQNHPYRIPVIGWEHEIETLSREDALAFYDRFYAPNNALVIVAGDVDAEAVKAMAETTYGKVERGPDLPPRHRPEEPAATTSRTVTLEDARVSLPNFARSWLVPSYRQAENGEAEALDVLSAILSDGPQSRLYQALVVKTGMAAQVGAAYGGSALDDGTFTLYGVPRPGNTLDDLEKAVATEVDELIANGISEAELERVKTRFIRSTIFAQDDQSAMAQTYGTWLTTERSVEDVALWPDRIRAVTPEQVKAVAVKYLRPAVAVTGYLLPPAAETKP